MDNPFLQCSKILGTYDGYQCANQATSPTTSAERLAIGVKHILSYNPYTIRRLNHRRLFIYLTILMILPIFVIGLVLDVNALS